MGILLTGVSGFAGAFLLRELLQNGFDVVSVDRTALPSQLESLTKHEKFEFIQADLKKDFYFPEGIDAIVHTAAQTQPSGVPVSDHIENNTLVTKRIVDYAIQAQVKKIINFSTLSVYGEIRTSVVDEDTEMINVSPYGMSKYLVEVILQEAAGRISSLSLRLPGLLPKRIDGPWLSKVYEKARRNEDIEVFNPNALFNNAVHMQDLAKFIASILETDWTGADVLTLGCADPLTIYETVKYLIDNCNSTSSIIIRKERKNSFMISNDKAMQKYGYRPSPLKDILKRLDEDKVQA